MTEAADVVVGSGPAGVAAATAVVAGGQPLAFASSRVEASAYADFTVPLAGARDVVVRY